MRSLLVFITLFWETVSLLSAIQFFQLIGAVFACISGGVYLYAMVYNWIKYRKLPKDKDRF